MSSENENYLSIELPYYSVISLEKTRSKNGSVVDYLIKNKDTFTVKKVSDKKDTKSIEPANDKFLQMITVEDLYFTITEFEKIVAEKHNSYYNTELEKILESKGYKQLSYNQKHNRNSSITNEDRKKDIQFSLLKNFVYMYFNITEQNINFIKENEISKFNIKEDNKEKYKSAIQFIFDNLRYKNDYIYFPHFIFKKIYDVKQNKGFLFDDEIYVEKKIAINNFVFNYFEMIKGQNIEDINPEIIKLYYEHTKKIDSLNFMKFNKNHNNAFYLTQEDNKYRKYLSVENTAYYSLHKYILLNNVDLSDIAQKITEIENSHKEIKIGTMSFNEALEQMNKFREKYFENNLKVGVNIK